MNDKYKIAMENFRSIRSAEVDLAPLTVVYGKNGAGKSSLIYGLLTLRNFLANPSLNAPGLFSYPSIFLGAFHEVVRGHDSQLKAVMSIEVSDPAKLSTTFSLSVGDSSGETSISIDNPARYKEEKQDFEWEMPKEINLEISIPYAGNLLVEEAYVIDPHLVDDSFHEEYPLMRGALGWNGITLNVQSQVEFSDSSRILAALSTRTNLPMQIARQTGFAPLRRGFSKPTYGQVSVSPYLINEDEVASSLASPNDRFKQYKVSNYFEEITSCRVQVQPQLGTSLFTIDVIPRDRGTPTSIVNEGFGLNQLLYMLTICLNQNYKIVAIEEPEIHLHPSMVRSLAKTLADIALQEDRRLVVSTHSEAFVVSLLTQMVSGNLPLDAVSFLLAEKRDGETLFEKCDANDKGQISGGLKPFMAAEMDDIAVFLGIDG